MATLVLLSPEEEIYAALVACHRDLQDDTVDNYDQKYTEWEHYWLTGTVRYEVVDPEKRFFRSMFYRNQQVGEGLAVQRSAFQQVCEVHAFKDLPTNYHDANALMMMTMIENV